MQLATLRNVVIILALLALSPITILPPGGHVTLAHGFSVGEEKEAGEKLLVFVRREFKLLDEPDLAQYINRLGRQALKTSGPQYFDYHFFVLDNKQFNAFAAPSGLIFFHTGLIETMADENELLSVMAHEIGHVQCRHIAERIDKSSKISLGTLAMILTGIAVGNPEVAEAVIVGSMATAETMILNFSRKDEEEADRFAYRLLNDSQRDPHATGQRDAAAVGDQLTENQPEQAGLAGPVGADDARLVTGMQRQVRFVDQRGSAALQGELAQCNHDNLDQKIRGRRLPRAACMTAVNHRHDRHEPQA